MKKLIYFLTIFSLTFASFGICSQEKPTSNQEAKCGAEGQSKPTIVSKDKKEIVLSNGLRFSPNSFLHAARRQNNTEWIKIALENGADINCKDHDGKYPALIEATSLNQTNMVRYLLDVNGVKTDVTSNWGDSALSIAVSNHNDTLVRALLDRDAPYIRNYERMNFYELGNHLERYYLRLYPIWEEVKKYREDSEKLVRSSSNWSSAIADIVASYNPAYHDKKELFINNAHSFLQNINRDNLGQLPLELQETFNTLSKQVHQTELHQLYTELSENIKDKGWITFLNITRNQRDALIKHTDEAGYTLLHLAAYYNKLNSIETLLEQGADINAKTRVGYTPEQFARHFGHEEAALYLAKYNKASHKLLNATSKGNLQEVQAALTEGANVNWKNHCGNSALVYAITNGSPRILDALIKVPTLNFDIDLGKTFQECINNNWMESYTYLDKARMLLLAGIDPSSFNKPEFQKLLSEPKVAAACRAWLNDASSTLNHQLPKDLAQLTQQSFSPTQIQEIQGKIHAAIKTGDLNTLKTLIPKVPLNASQEDASKKDETEKARAENKENKENKENAEKVVELLTLEHADDAGYTPLLLAAYYGNDDAVRWLIEQGANIDATSIAGKDITAVAEHGKALAASGQLQNNGNEHDIIIRYIAIKRQEKEDALKPKSTTSSELKKRKKFEIKEFNINGKMVALPNLTLSEADSIMDDIERIIINGDNEGLSWFLQEFKRIAVNNQVMHICDLSKGENSLNMVGLAIFHNKKEMAKWLIKNFNAKMSREQAEQFPGIYTEFCLLANDCL